ADKPDELMNKPEPKPDYDLIFNIIEKEIKSFTRTEAIKLLNTKKEFDKIAKKIKNKKDVLKLDTDIKDEIDFEIEYVTENQKKELYKLHENKIQELKGTKKFNKLLKNIKDEFFIGNLLDDKLHDSLIKVSGLTEEQKNILQQARKDQLIT
ncbi:11137_t:CDS:2, partial [Dentiscutata heterogama]